MPIPRVAERSARVCQTPPARRREARPSPPGDAQDSGDVAVVLQRTDNVVHVVWAHQLAGIPDGHAGVIRLAESVEDRMPG
jgi:hypothetical protein